MDVRCRSWRLADNEKLSDQILRMRALRGCREGLERSTTAAQELSLASSSSPDVQRERLHGEKARGSIRPHRYPDLSEMCPGDPKVAGEISEICYVCKNEERKGEQA
jgi:hypothetical protein